MRSWAARLALALLPWTAVLLVPGIEAAAGGKYHTLRGAACSAERWVQRADTLMLLTPTLLALAAARGLPGAALLLVVWAAPNVLRHACLALMSSFSHYYGDVRAGEVAQENQILRHWALAPLQAFCCNFGAEHVIHHYCVVRAPRAGRSSGGPLRRSRASTPPPPVLPLSPSPSRAREGPALLDTPPGAARGLGGARGQWHARQ